MPDYPVYHTYADVNAFRDYLAGTGQSAGWTQDTSVVLRILESVSRTMDQAVGWRSWGPRTQTRLYDIDERTQLVPGVVPLDDWLINATGVTAYSDTSRTSSQTLTEGIAGDYLLEPYNDSPKHTLKLTEITTTSLGGGQQTLTIAGTWGWQNVTAARTTLSGAVSSTTATSITVTDTSAIAPGSTLVVDSEQLYVSAVSGSSLTVVRGVNGTTAATHPNGAEVRASQYPADVVQVCLEIARNRWKERDAGTGQTIGAGSDLGGVAISRPGAEERALLRRLQATYLGRREHGGVFF